MSFSVSDQQLENHLNDVFAKLTGKQVRHAHARALTKTARDVKPAILKESAGKLAISQKHLRPRIKVTGAKVKNLTARVWGGSTPLPLIKLKAKEVPGGVQAGKYLVPDAFIATPTSSPKQNRKSRKKPSSQLVGRTQVFSRKGKGAYPLKAEGVNVERVLNPVAQHLTKTAMRTKAKVNLLREYKQKVLKNIPKNAG